MSTAKRKRYFGTEFALLNKNYSYTLEKFGSLYRCRIGDGDWHYGRTMTAAIVAARDAEERR